MFTCCCCNLSYAQAKDPVDNVRVWLIMETPKQKNKRRKKEEENNNNNNKHALKVSVFKLLRQCRTLRISRLLLNLRSSSCFVEMC